VTAIPFRPDVVVGDPVATSNGRGRAFDVSRAVDGATFVDSVPDRIPAAWGEPGGAVAWANGEGLMLVGPEGVGKSTLAQQLVLARLGLRQQVLGMTVAPAAGRVLYIAADRPRQAASSLRRMVTPADRDTLRERLVVWQGPLPFDLATEPRALAEFVASFEGVTDVFIDSLKDVAADLVKDDVGSRCNIAFQELVASGVELCVLHHQRKASSEGAKPRSLADVYGSRWLTAGMGSVVLLWGEPGDLVVELRHLKQPAEEVGPLSVQHDHATGSSTVRGEATLADALAQPGGVTARDAACRMFDTEHPTPNETEKARRRLNSLVSRGDADSVKDPETGVVRYSARAGS